MQTYLMELQQAQPEMPWDTTIRLVKQYSVGQRDVETLLALDEFDGAGIRYFEEVTLGDVKLGKRAINW